MDMAYNLKTQTRIMAFFDVIDGRRYVANEETVTGGILYAFRNGDARWLEYWEAGKLRWQWDVKPGMVDHMVDLIIVDFLQAVHHAGDTHDTYAQHAYRAF